MSNDWRHERELFLVALRFYTRIRVALTVPHLNAMGAASRYLPLIGVLIGGVGALVYALALLLWVPAVALLLSMAATILLTGALHEDGLADACDGFGGGWQRDQVLRIMKDSRLGSFGALGLGLLLSLKFLALQSLYTAGLVIPALLVGHSWSRLVAISYVVDYHYAGDASQSKIESITAQFSGADFRIAIVTVLPLVLLISLWQFLAVALVLLLWRWCFGYYMTRRIGGYTGDCLGAAQQISEVLIYLTLVALA